MTREEAVEMVARIAYPDAFPNEPWDRIAMEATAEGARVQAACRARARAILAALDQPAQSEGAAYAERKRAETAEAQLAAMREAWETARKSLPPDPSLNAPWSRAMAIMDEALAALDQPAQGPWCECFGDLGVHASTHGGSNGERLCDLCGRPICQEEPAQSDDTCQGET